MAAGSSPSRSVPRAERPKPRSRFVQKEEKWAVMERMPNIKDDFSALVPQPACEYPFELDVFQKEAIYHMEQVRAQHQRRLLSAGAVAHM
jgi:superfamily II RNA helicase